MIRTLTLDDAERAAALIRAAFATLATVLDPAPSALGLDAAAITAHLAAGGGGALHAHGGCILWKQRDDALFLSRLAVLPEARGQGVATALLAYAETVGRREGYTRLCLEVRLALEGNRRLFRRAGFIETARHSHPGYAHPTYVAAEKRLRLTSDSCDRDTS